MPVAPEKVTIAFSPLYRALCGHSMAQTVVPETRRSPSGWRDPEISGYCRTAAMMCMVLLWFGATAWAQKVDIVRLRNGDRITCEITTLNRGVLTINTDSLGKVSIHWGQVDGIESPRTFNVQLVTGDRLYGSLIASAASTITVSDASGVPVTRAQAEVVQLMPIGRSFWRRLDGTLDLGFSFAQANLDTRASLNGSVTYRSQTYQHGASYASQVSTREDADREYRTDLHLTASRYLGTRWYGIGWGGFQQNDELSLDLRLVGGGGFGREVVHTNRRLWSIYGGVAYTRELYTDEPTEISTEGTVGGHLDFFTPGSDKFSLTNRIVSYVNLSGRRRVRLELQSAWRHEFLEDFYWSLNGFESFDSDPPNEQKQNDLGVSFAIGWKF